MPDEKDSRNLKKAEIASPSKYLCPACEKGFDKTIKIKGKRGVYCPNCETKLVVSRGRDPNTRRFTISYNLSDPAGAWMAGHSEKEEQPEKSELYPVKQLTDEAANPQVIVMSDDTYRSIWVRAKIGVMIRCPKCHKAIWQNNNLGGGADYKCPRCKAETKFIFLRDGNIASVIELLTVPQSR